MAALDWTARTEGPDLSLIKDIRSKLVIHFITPDSSLSGGGSIENLAQDLYNCWPQESLRFSSASLSAALVGYVSR
jgi:hypothetical protein